MLKDKVIPYLTDLPKNNTKEWFTTNKVRYEEAYADFKKFIDALIFYMAQTDPSLNGVTAKDCVYRIYRDVRFSHDKTPYKNHFGAYIAREGRKSKKAGFYLHISPCATSISGGGIHMPEPDVLKALRSEFYTVPEDLLEILEAKTFKKYSNGLMDEGKLKTAPKGFPKDFEHIDLLKYKNYIAIKELSNTEIENPDLLQMLVEIHKAMYPLIRLINTIIEDAKL